ncbi:heterokaryon incompatibility protein-domain-containing protein, partial [Paraphoma chrysanthemicola]
MRLLHLQGDAWEKGPLDLAIREFVADDAPPYLIVSHRWREDEVLFADLNVSSSSMPDVQSKKGFAKLRTTCRIASQMGLRYLWIDTCCIDKSSSSDVAEAVVSMYDWYANARCCIAYLDDIHVTSDLSQSSWFSRGWTLPELIAPEQVIFYSTDWIELGTKASLSLEVSITTGIEESVLWHRNSLDRVCVSEKLSWAARRSTTRPEDESYALMGLFGIRMLPMYGEGRERAFMRLQTEIMQITADHTLFAW